MCKYSEIINTNSEGGYATYNVKAANLLGLTTAVYVQWLIYIDVKSDQKQKKTKDGFMLVDRKFIDKMANITPATQKTMDSTLEKLGLITISPENTEHIKFDSVAFLKMLTNTNSEAQREIQNTCNDKIIKKSAKNTSISDNLKGMVATSGLPSNIVFALNDWIDILISVNKTPNKITINTTLKQLKEYCGSNYTAMLEIIENCSASGWRDMYAGIERYMKIHKCQTIPQTEETTNSTNQEDYSHKVLTAEGEF